MRMILNRKAFTLVELLVVLTIFGFVLAGIYTAYITQIRNATQEYRLAGTELELGIAKNIIERDIGMAGYGLADNYDTLVLAPLPVPIQANAAQNTLTMRGTALGLNTRFPQTWSYISATNPNFQIWNDSREDLVANANARVILMEPTTRTLRIQAGTWQYQYQDSASDLNPSLASPTVGTLVYGIESSGAAPATQPYAAVTYSLTNVGVPAACAPQSQMLLRAESWTGTPGAGAGQAVLACVLDMRVAFGLDSDENGTIDLWDNWGVQAGGYDIPSLERRLKQVRVYLLVQASRPDPRYNNPQTTIRVGDASLGIGQDWALTAAQRGYRWRLLSISITPRNLR